MDKDKNIEIDNELIKRTSEGTLNAVNKNLDNIGNIIAERTEHTTKMPDKIMRELDANTLAIASRNLNLDTGTLFTFNGLKDESGVGGNVLEEKVTSGLSASVASINNFMPNGNHAFIRMVDQNIYLAENFPALEESLSLFIDSCVNGSYTGDPLASSHTPFKYYTKSGAEITNVSDIARYNELLVPSKSISVNLESFFDIEIRIRKRQRRDGMALVRYVPFRKVLKELYIKYLLKKTKVKQMKKGDKTVKVTRVPNRVPTVQGKESVANNFHFKTFKQIDREEIEKEIPDNELKEIQMYGEESFYDFVERYCLGNTEVGVEYANGKNIKPFSADGKESEVNRHLVSFESGRFSKDATNEIVAALKDVYRYTKRIDTYGTEAADTNYTTIEHMLMGNKTLQSVSFEDIYDTAFPEEFDIDSMNIGFESTDGGKTFEEPQIRNTTQRLLFDTARLIDLELNEIGVESFDAGVFPDELLSTYVLNHRDGSPKPTPKQMLSQDKVNDNVIAKDNNIKEPNDPSVNTNIPHGRIEKLFASVKGGVVEILDSQRTVPVMPGKRVLGAFYITHSHELMRNLILTRQFMTQPAAFMNLTDSEYEYAGSQEDLVGRLMFADHLKPLIEKNISTKFLRENADVMYTIQKIMEDQELSNSISYQDVANYNMVNLSRVTFIPASELHVSRNTDYGFGESFFQKARVPANFRIIANEAYLAWIIHDGKPINLVRVQAGLGDGGGIYGTNNAIKQFASRKLTRGGLRRINGRGQSISGDTIIYQTQGQEDLVSVNQVPGYELRIERDMLRQWENEATSIVGFNMALFTSEDGRIELARKLADLDEIQTSKIIHEQRREARPASERATRLLHLRGGEDVKDVIVEYMPPYLTRDNNIKQSEVIKEIGDTFEALKGVYESKYEENEDFQESKSYVWNVIMDKMNISDALITGSDDIVAEAKRRKETFESMVAKETK